MGLPHNFGATFTGAGEFGFSAIFMAKGGSGTFRCG